MNLLWKCEKVKKSMDIKTNIQVTIFPILKERRSLFETKSCFSRHFLAVNWKNEGWIQVLVFAADWINIIYALYVPVEY